MQSTSRPRGDSSGHRRVRNQICSRAIPGSMTWIDDMAALISGLTTCLITVSLAGKETRFRPRNCTSSTCQHFRQFCYGNYSIRLTLWRLSPMQSLWTKMICTRRSGHSSGHLPVDKHIATDTDLASAILSASLDSRSIYICDV
jgi:hypothetical protein